MTTFPLHTLPRRARSLLLSALAFAMAMLPEEIPMVMTVFIGLAAWRMARVKVLARRPAVV